MRKVECVLLAFVLAFCVASFAADKAPLSDRELNAVTAGYFDASGVLAAAGSTADVSKNQSVTLSGNAQNQAEAANIVDAISTKFAAGLNVWAADSVTVGGAVDSVEAFNPIEQKNFVLQFPTLSAGAFLAGYDRGIQVSFDSLTFNLDIEKTFTASKTASFDATLAASFAEKVAAEVAVPVDVDAAAKTASTDSLVPIAKFTKTVDATLDATATASLDEQVSASKKLTTDLTVDGFLFKGPLTIDEAAAEVIAVDGSKVTYSADSTISLSDYAQAGAKAINIVNAINSLIGVGTNVAYSPSSTYSALGVHQANVIIQK